MTKQLIETMWNSLHMMTSEHWQQCHVTKETSRWLTWTHVTKEDWSQSHVDFLSCDRRHLQKRLVITLNVCVNILKITVQKLIGGCWFQDVLVWNSSGINTHFICLSSYLRVKQHSESERNDCAKADTKAVPTIVSTLLVVRKYCCDVRQKITRYVLWLKSLDRSFKVPVGCVLFVMWTVGRHFISQ